MVVGITFFGSALVLALGWLLGEYDPALTAYGLSVVWAAASIAQRFHLWLQRPATGQIFRQAGRVVRGRTFWTALLPIVGKRCFDYFACNAFVWKRSKQRWAAHWPIMLGCVMAASIAFPLVFGWVWFESDPLDLHIYIVHVFGLPVQRMAIDSFTAFMLFHGLVWASFPVLIGVIFAAYRRSLNRGDHAVQTLLHDFVPLGLLALISLTGLYLSISYSFLDGWGHKTMALIHAFVVIVTILWLPHGKLWHIIQRSLKAAFIIYDTEAQQTALQQCESCDKPYATQQQIADLKTVEAQLGFTYTLNNSHYQHICPQCRRSLVVCAQNKRWGR